MKLEMGPFKYCSSSTFFEYLPDHASLTVKLCATELIKVFDFPSKPRSHVIWVTISDEPMKNSLEFKWANNIEVRLVDKPRSSDVYIMKNVRHHLNMNGMKQFNQTYYAKVEYE